MCSLLLSYTVMAQKVDEVTLVTSGSASTEQEATLVALRSAIEQTFGTFVSSNTTMVNDELIKDEIVSISNGNVKNYEKLSSNVLSNGHVSVSVKATICISKLISYAKSKGSSAEFAGQTFAMNIKLKELREKNTITAIKHMVDECIILAKDAFDFQIELGEAKVARNITTFAVHQDNDKNYKSKKDELTNFYEGDAGYIIPLKVKILANTATSLIWDLYDKTMRSLKFQDAEILNYENQDVSSYFNLTKGISEKLPDKVYEAYHKQKVRLYNALYKSMFAYKLVEISNPQNSYIWTTTFRRTTRLRGFAMYEGVPISNVYRLLINPRDEIIEIAKMKDNRIGFEIDYHENRYKPKDPNDMFKLLRSLKYNIPEHTLTEYAKNHEQEVTSYVIDLFVPKDSISNFNGIKLERQQDYE